MTIFRGLRRAAWIFGGGTSKPTSHLHPTKPDEAQVAGKVVRTVQDSNKTHDKNEKSESTEASERAVDDVARLLRGVMRQVPRPVVVITTLDFPHFNRSDRSLVAPPHWTAKEQADLQYSKTDKRWQRIHRHAIPRAMVVSSINSLSMTPPRVVFSVGLPNRTWEAIRRNGWFHVHILTANKAGARIADMIQTQAYSQPRAQDAEMHKVMGTPPEDWGARQWMSNERRKRKLCRLAALEELPGFQVQGLPPGTDEWAPDCMAPSLRGPGVLNVLKCQVDAPKHIRLQDPQEDETATLVIGRVREVVGTPVLFTSIEQEKEALGYLDRHYRGVGKKLVDLYKGRGFKERTV